MSLNPNLLILTVRRIDDDNIEPNTVNSNQQKSQNCIVKEEEQTLYVGVTKYLLCEIPRLLNSGISLIYTCDRLQGYQIIRLGCGDPKLGTILSALIHLLTSVSDRFKVTF